MQNSSAEAERLNTRDAQGGSVNLQWIRLSFLCFSVTRLILPKDPESLQTNRQTCSCGLSGQSPLGTAAFGWLVLLVVVFFCRGDVFTRYLDQCLECRILKCSVRAETEPRSRAGQQLTAEWWSLSVVVIGFASGPNPHKCA